MAADSPEPRPQSGTFVAMPATVESPGIKLSLSLFNFYSATFTFMMSLSNSKTFKFAGPRDFEGGNTRKAFVDSMLKAEQV